MPLIKNEINNLINVDSDVVILDVDRTIINTTSWYRACICDDLLISKQNIDKFKKINDETYSNPTDEKLKKFRIETLDLIEKNISGNYVKKVGNLDKLCNIGDYTNSWRFYIAGVYTAQKLVKIYDEAIKFIRYLSVYFGNRLKIIFLTAGYESFIRGVIDGIIDKANLNYLNYTVIGSKLKFEKENIKETFNMDQFKKQEFVETIINMGRKVRFLVDDSSENINLFEIVKNNGGMALKIEHEPNQQINKTWKNFIENITEEKTKNKIKNDDLLIGINKNEIQMPEFLKKLSNNTNKIGITSIKTEEYECALNSLIKKIKDNNKREIFIQLNKKIIFEKEKVIYLRGKLFYNWLPQYIFLDDIPLNDRWKELMHTCIEILDIVNENKLIEKDLKYFEKVIVYSYIDNLLEGIMFIVNLIEQNSLNDNDLHNNESEKVIQLAQGVSDLLYAFIYNDEGTKNILNELLLNLKQFELIKSLNNYTKKYRTMRELDDNITIFKFVKSVIDKAEKENIDFDYIISFPFGGIALGFAMISYLKIVLKKQRFPKNINSHFSSKQKIRENRMEEDIDFNIFKYIPKFYSKEIQEIKKGKSKILLLDNNVTTFKTLDLCKNFLTQLGNTVYAGVPAVNYDNIINCLFNKENEPLVENWRYVLDFQPIDEYVTAFNTWNTSVKTKELQKIYEVKNNIQLVEKFNAKVEEKKYIFKLCRVQNIQDLKVAIKNGVNMIGIHAVYPDRIKYLKNESKYHPIENNLKISEKLPVGVLELEGIKDIQSVIPENMKQAILFERPLDINNMVKTCEEYGLPKEKMYIQLQHRTDENYIMQIKQKLCKNILTTIGLFQKDFSEYFWKMNNVLDPKTDYILLDLSKHQPDLIAYSESYKESINRVYVLNHLAKNMENNDVPIILADDTTTSQMNEYLKVISKYNIKIKGIDMQNTVELATNEQKYQMLEHDGKVYQVKIRKSATKMAEWKQFFNKINKDIFLEKE